MADQPGIVLYNRSRFNVFSATMYHSVVCKALNGGCLCETQEQAGTTATYRLEASFRIPPKSYSAVLPEQVLLIPQVQAALKGPSPWLVQATKLQPVQKLVAAAPKVAAAPIPKSSRSDPVSSSAQYKNPSRRR